MKHTAVLLFSTLLLALVALLLPYSCTKPTPFGSDLLGNEVADYAFTDTITLQCTVLPEDSLNTSDLSSTADYMLCGQLNDPVFGKSESELYTLMRLTELDPDFKGATVDSIVMYLRYDAPGFYGDTLQPQTLRVHRLATDTVLQYDKTYYSNQKLPVGTQIGELVNFLPRPNTSIHLFDTTTSAPFVRIPLDNAFGQEILNLDSLSLTSDTTFWKVLRGMRITAESASSPGAMMAFDMDNNSFSRVRLYYKQDTSHLYYDFDFLSGNKFTHFTHDYTGSTVEPYIGHAANDRLFVQGMGGLRLKVELPNIHQLNNIAVNKAELDLTALTLPNDNPLLNPASQLVFTEIIGDTTVTFSSDVLYALGPTLSGGFAAFGGFPKTETDQGMSVQRYRLTLTQRLQRMVDNASGNIKDQTIYLDVYPQSRSAMRAVFYGPTSSTFPVKLALKYTKVQ